MSYLLYCILQKSPADQEKTNLRGVEGEPVILMTKNDLSATASPMASRDLIPNLSQLLAYGKVIESFHRDHALIPLRFGCLLEKESQVMELLEKNSEKYKRLLQQLHGCVEIGIRFLPPGERPRLLPPIRTDPFSRNSKENPACPDAATPSGRAYLASRKIHYDLVDRSTKKIEAVINDCREAFAGLYFQCKTETRSAFAPHSIFRPSLVSLYFLISQSAVEQFRCIFKQISANQPGKILWTGPWPPYNFAMLDETSEDQANLHKQLKLFAPDNYSNPILKLW